MSIRFAVLGLGRAGTTLHLPALRRLRGAEVAVVCDPDPAAGAGLPERRTRDWREAIALDVDAVLVATPPETHAELAAAALEAGCHVYLEKPAATSAWGKPQGSPSSRTSTIVGSSSDTRTATTRSGGRRGGSRSSGRCAPTGASLPQARAEPDGSCPRSISAGITSTCSRRCSGRRRSRSRPGAPDRLRVRWPDGSTLEGDYRPGPPQDRVALGEVTVDRVHGLRLRGLPQPGLVLTRLRGPGWERSYEYALAALVHAIETGTEPEPGPQAGIVGAAVGEAVLRSLASGHAEPVELPAEVRA